MFSAFYLDPTHGWIATHRLPLDSAIHYCQEYREQHYECPVALVPDGENPTPFMILAEARARYVQSRRNHDLLLGLIA